MSSFASPRPSPWPPSILWPVPKAAIWVSDDGEIAELTREEAAHRAELDMPLVCHAHATARRLGCRQFPALDVLELFAFARPARFCIPTPRGLALALEISEPGNHLEEAQILPRAAEVLLDELSANTKDRSACSIARIMHDCGWPWGPLVLKCLGFAEFPPPGPINVAGLDVWRQLPEWSEHAPEPPARNQPVSNEETRARLASLLGKGAEARPSQADFASAVSDAFLPREHRDQPRMVLAEAGTGVGKTLGYVAPASLWAEKNSGTVWFSTFTRNLQHQIDDELNRLHKDPIHKAQKVVIRKGRENYICLLNLEEASRSLAITPQYGTAIGLMARWVEVTRDGDMTGGDFPSWLSELLGRGRTLGLADRRGECIFSGCTHYHKCFIEKSIRMARRAEIVVANHALVMVQAALGGIDDTYLPTRYVFDEGHHVFDAADSAFSAHLSGLETADLRRWLTGTGGRRSGRSRGLKRRISDLISESPEALKALEKILRAATALPGEGWINRLTDGQPNGPTETFLSLVRQQVYARTRNANSPYTLEIDCKPPIASLVVGAMNLDRALSKLLTPILDLRRCLSACLENEAQTMETSTRFRIEAVIRSLTKRGQGVLEAWRNMLRSLDQATPDEFIDWFEINRVEGRDIDIGMHRHWLDPTIPLHDAVLRQAHGVVITSATLRDATGETEYDWRTAEQRTGAAHLATPVIRVAVASPFNYAEQTRVFIVNDVRKDDLTQVAAAYRELFLASGGGALGLFTAIQRLRAIYTRIARPLDEAGLTLYAQHIDGLDLATLIDIFRAEENACLMGTDAARDGVDVPGQSLRLITFDRVPWPRPNVLHRARREAYGTGAYTDMQTRLKIRQAFGRLIRRADDKGVFILLDPMMPTRLLGAFPEGTPIERCGLAEALSATKSFFP